MLATDLAIRSCGMVPCQVTRCALSSAQGSKGVSPCCCACGCLEPVEGWSISLDLQAIPSHEQVIGTWAFSPSVHTAPEIRTSSIRML
jgi:hypothetical protein